MKQLAIFDFDGTLYANDSFICFFKFIFKKRILRIFYLIPILWYFTLFKLKVVDSHRFKQFFLIVLNGIEEEELKGYVEKFWKKQSMKCFNPKLVDQIKKLKAEGVTIVCISASPRLLITYPLHNLGIDNVIATEMSYQNGRYSLVSKNCRGKEKIKRLYGFYGTDVKILEAYSDNKDDVELLLLAERGFQIKGTIIKKINKI